MAHVLSSGPLAMGLYLWLPLVPCCAQRHGSHHSGRAGWQLPGLTLAHRAQQEGRGLVPRGEPHSSQAHAQICRLAAFPAQGLPLGQAGLGDSSRENSGHKIMDCDKSHKQGDSKALGPGPVESFQPGQLGMRGWERPKRVRWRERHPGSMRWQISYFCRPLLPPVKREAGLDLVCLELIIGLPRWLIDKKICSPVQETWVQSLAWEDPLEKEMAPHSSILTGKSHGQRSLAGCRPRGHRVGHDRVQARTSQLSV